MDVTAYKNGVNTDIADKTGIPGSIVPNTVRDKLNQLADLMATGVNDNSASIATLDAGTKGVRSLTLTYDNYLNTADIMPSKYIDATGALLDAPNATYAVVRLFGLKPSHVYVFQGSMHAVNAGARWGTGTNANLNQVTNLHSAETEVPSGSLPWVMNTPSVAFDFILLSVSVGVTAENYGDYMVSDGNTVKPYVPYGAQISEDNLNLPSYYTKDQAAEVFVEANTFSKNALKVNPTAPGTDDMVVIGSGVGASPAYAIIAVGLEQYSVARVPLLPSMAYIYSGTLDGASLCRFRFEDADGVFISGYDPAVDGISAMPIPFNTPAGCAFAWVPTRVGSSNDYNTLMVRKASESAGYEPYRKTVAPEVIPAEFLKQGDIISRLAGEDVLLVGDSQIAFNLWPPVMAAQFGTNNILNGVAGSCVTPGFGAVPTQSLCSAARLATIVGLAATAKLIGICAGGNDSIQNVPVGTPTDVGSSAATTFCSAVNYVLEYLQANATTKNKRIVWVGVLWTHGTFADRQQQYDHTLLYDDANRLCCERHGIPYLSTLKLSGITRENEDVYTGDGTHLNDVGKYPYAGLVGSWFNIM